MLQNVLQYWSQPFSDTSLLVLLLFAYFDGIKCRVLNKIDNKILFEIKVNQIIQQLSAPNKSFCVGLARHAPKTKLLCYILPYTSNDKGRQTAAQPPCSGIW